MTLIPAVDISQWQVTTPDPKGAGLVICRATYSTGYDTRYASHAADVRRNGDYLGAYGFGVPGDGAAQAKALLKTAPDVDQMQLASGKWVDLYALDLEPEHGVEMTNAQAQAFIAAMHSKGKTVGLYHSASGYPELGQDWRWVADWRGSEPTLPWDIWQFTNKAEDGTPLDRDYCKRPLRRKENKIVASLTPAAEPLVYTGVIASVLVGTGLATTGEAASLAPGIAAILTAIPTLLMLIGRQFVTPNGKVPTPAPINVTPNAPTAPVTPDAPIVKAPIAVSTVASREDLPAGSKGSVTGTTRRWDGEDPYPELDPITGDHVLALKAKVVMANTQNHAPHGTFYLTDAKAPVLIDVSDVTPVTDAPPAPYEPGPTAGSTDPQDASPGSSLTGPEYLVLVSGAQTPVDFLAQCKAWTAANIGTPLYLERLYNRLNVYCNTYRGGNHAAGIVAAIQSIMVDIYRAEQISTGTGVGQIDRKVPFNQLVKASGDYVTAPEDLQAILLAAQPADAWMATPGGVLTGGPAA